MRRVLPYTLPLLLSLLFVSTSDSPWIGLSPVLIYFAGVVTPFFGEFSVRQLLDEYHFFHFSPTMAVFKSINGFFFVALNGWSYYFLATHPLPVWQFVIYLYGMVILNSNFAISLAHDLMHSRFRMDRLLASVLLLQNGFFYLESDHLYIHHRHVGTEHDPASPLRNESIYRYFRRSFAGRLAMILGRNPVFPKTKETQLVRQNQLKLTLCVMYLMTSTLFHWQVFVWILVQYLLVILIYESITYIQHYGLRRISRANGYEPVQLHHSWNSFYRLNTYLYFMMPVHSLHHLWQPDHRTIRDFAGPRMPLPFAKMMLTAYRPVKWFALMNDSVFASI